MGGESEHIVLQITVLYFIQHLVNRNTRLTKIVLNGNLWHMEFNLVNLLWRDPVRSENNKNYI